MAFNTDRGVVIMPYLGKAPNFGVRQRYIFTQSGAGATSISGSDDSGVTLKFSDGNFVDVYLNGVLLVSGMITIQAPQTR